VFFVSFRLPTHQLEGEREASASWKSVELGLADRKKPTGRQSY
jgi:hypothetical protein